jgi:hypothetical protein
LAHQKEDAAYIEDLKMQDQVLYSTITIEIYENPKYKQWLIPNAEIIKEYKPGFAKRLWESVKEGGVSWKI